MPTVAYDVDGLRDAVRPGETGWLLPEGADLAKGITAAIDELQVAPDTYSVKCREWADRFSWDGSAARLAALIRRPPDAPAAPVVLEWEER